MFVTVTFKSHLREANEWLLITADFSRRMQWKMNEGKMKKARSNIGDYEMQCITVAVSLEQKRMLEIRACMGREKLSGYYKCIISCQKWNG